MTQDNSESPHQSSTDSDHPQRLVREKSPLLLLTLLAISVIIGVIYTHFYVKRALNQTQVALQQLHAQQSAMQRHLHEDNAERQKITQARIDALDSKLEQARQAQPTQTSDWLLLKVRYCLQLASINNLWTDDKPTTLGLLDEADSLLSQLESEGVTSVRKAIAAEKIKLQSIPSLDITGILSTLHALEENVGHLSLLQAEKTPTSSSQPQDKSVGLTKTWREHLHQALRTLQSLVVIRHQDDLNFAYLDPAARSILIEAMRMNLQAAQLAVIQRQPSIYHQMLEQAIQSTKRLFDPQDAKTSAFIKQIKQLESINLTEPKPSLDEALTRLNQLIQMPSNQSPGSET